MIGRRRIARDGPGRYRVRLGQDERQLLRALPAQAASVVGSDDPAAARLTPAAFPDDPEAEADYRQVVGGELLDAHRRALDDLAATAGDERLDQAQLEGWLRAVEVIRLVLGTELGVTADAHLPPERDPRFGRFVLYGWLSGLQDDIVTALSEGLSDRA